MRHSIGNPCRVCSLTGISKAVILRLTGCGVAYYWDLLVTVSMLLSLINCPDNLARFKSQDGRRQISWAFGCGERRLGSWSQTRDLDRPAINVASLYITYAVYGHGGGLDVNPKAYHLVVIFYTMIRARPQDHPALSGHFASFKSHRRYPKTSLYRKRKEHLQPPYF